MTERKPIKKAWLYDESAGETFMTMEEFAYDHVQDEEAAIEIAERIMQVGYSDNFDESARVFEVYSLRSERSTMDLAIQLLKFKEKVENG